MAYAVVDADEGFVPQERKGSGGDGDRGEGGAHAGAAGVADAVYIWDSDIGDTEGLEGDADEEGAVVGGGVFGEEAGAGGGDEGVADVGEDGGGVVFVENDANAQFVG